MHRTIVTGGTRGIGLAIARAILAGGGRVLITGRDPQGVDRAVRELASSADEARVAGLPADVADRDAVDRVVAHAHDRFGGLDVLVNNAGVGGFSNVESMSDDDWHRIIDTNLTGVFYYTRAAIPVLRRSGGGWIVNIASLAARNYVPGGSAYCASKAGLLAFSESVMQEVREHDIRVTVVMPGSVATEFNDHTPGEADAWKLTPDDVAQVVMDLLAHPARSLPSKVEMRPSKPPKK
jgi:NAD(P)-dependent dehydrogenase (short-subunit alcohol dehydrogenase family)